MSEALPNHAGLLAVLDGRGLCHDCAASAVHRPVREVARVLDDLRRTYVVSALPAIRAGCFAVRIAYRPA